MAYRIELTGMDELYNNIKKLRDKAPGVASAALYEGARVVADAVSREVKSISTAPFKYAKDGEKRKPSPEEKAAIVGAPHGVSRFRRNLHAVDTAVGYNQSGYVDVNFNHMNGSARTNYKKFSFKGKENTASSTLKWIRYQGGSEKYGLSKDIGRGAQNQKPVGVIANAINSGTSFMQKQPFMRKAFSKSKAAATAAIENKINEAVAQIANE